MGQSKTQFGRWGRGLGRRHSLFSEGQPLLGAWAGDVQQDTRCARCCLLPRCTPRTHPRSSGLFLQKKKTSRVIQRALDDARESRASPMRSRKGFGKGTLAMAARGSCPHAGAAGARAGWAGELSVLLPAMLVSGEKALFSSCHSATFQRLSLRLLPPPRSQMCAVQGPENSLYACEELQHPPKLPAPTPRGC